MKRIGAVLFLMILAMSLAACGSGSSSGAGGTGGTGGSGGGGSSSGAASAKYSTITAPSGTQYADSNSVVKFTIQAYDSSDNKVTVGGASVAASATNGAVILGTHDNKDGTYTVSMKSAVIGTSVVSFTVAGTASPSTASVKFLTPTADNYYVPYTSDGYTSGGLYLIDASNPSAVPVTVTTGAIDSGLPTTGLATFYRMAYDPKTHAQVEMQPAFVVYGQSGHIYGVDLSHAGGSATQLTNGTYTTLCSLSPIATGSYGITHSWVVAKVLTSASPAGSGCLTPSAASYWVFPTTASASTAPIVVPAFSWAGSLHDPSTGEVTDIVIFTGTELDLYSPATFTKTSTLQNGFAAGSTAMTLGEAIGYAGDIVDVENVTSTEQDDYIYTVTSAGATKEMQYTIPTNSLPALNPNAGGCGSTGQTSYTIDSISSGDAVVYEVPDTTGGFDVNGISLNGGVPYNIYYDSSNCFYRFQDAENGYVVMNIRQPNQNTNVRGADFSESISANAGNSQTPVMLASNTTVLSTYKASVLRYVAGGYAWVDSLTYNSSYNVTGHDVNVLKLSDGSVAKTYTDTGIIGDVWGGIDADGNIIRSKILLGGGTINTSCDDLALTSMTQEDSSLSGSNTASMSGTECWQPSVYGPSPLPIGSFYSASDSTSWTLYGLDLGTNGSGATLETFGTDVANSSYDIALVMYAY